MLVGFFEMLAELQDEKRQLIRSLVSSVKRRNESAHLNELPAILLDGLVSMDCPPFFDARGSTLGTKYPYARILLRAQILDFGYEKAKSTVDAYETATRNDSAIGVLESVGVLEILREAKIEADEWVMN